MHLGGLGLSFLSVTNGWFGPFSLIDLLFSALHLDCPFGCAFGCAFACTFAFELRLWAAPLAAPLSCAFGLRFWQRLWVCAIELRLWAAPLELLYRDGVYNQRIHNWLWMLGQPTSTPMPTGAEYDLSVPFAGSPKCPKLWSRWSLMIPYKIASIKLSL